MTREEERLMWRTYWKVRYNPEKICNHQEKYLYNRAGRLLYSERYINNKSRDGFSLPTFQRLMSLLCKRH